MVTYYLKLFYSRHAATLLYYIVVLFYLVICVSPFFMRTVMHIRFTKPLAFSLDEILTLRVSSTLYFHYVKELTNCRGGGFEPPICITCHPIKVELYQLSYSPLYSQSTPSFSFNSWKLLSNSSTINFMSFRMSHIPLLDFSYTPFYHIGNCISNTQTNADYYYFKHIFQNLISVHKIVYSTMRTQIRRSDVRVEL